LSEKRLAERIHDLKVVDTHEHLYPFHRLMEKGRPDIYTVLEGSYIDWITDLPRESLEALASVLLRIAGSGFYTALALSLKDLYGVDVSRPTAEALSDVSEAIGRAYTSGEWMRRVLKERCGIVKALLDPYWMVWGEKFDRELFAPVLRVNMLLFGYSRTAKDHNGNSPYQLADTLGFDIGHFRDYLEFVDAVIERAKREGYVALKSALAYDRPLTFSDPSEEEARRVFEKGAAATEKEALLFGDFILRRAMAKAYELGLPVQFHTGLGLIEGSNPVNLVNLIRRFPDITFVLFHGGYPWIRETAALALTFRNVYVDLCWLPAISPSACKALLRSLIEVGAISRTMWGGDCWVVEGTYGALMLFKRLLTQVLSGLTSKGFLKPETALEMAEMILRENAERLFHWEGDRPPISATSHI